MNSKKTIEEMAQKQSWSKDSMIIVLTNFINIKCSQGDFDNFLEYTIRKEEELTKEELDKPIQVVITVYNKDRVKTFTINHFMEEKRDLSNIEDEVNKKYEKYLDEEGYYDFLVTDLRINKQIAFIENGHTAWELCECGRGRIYDGCQMCGSCFEELID